MVIPWPDRIGWIGSIFLRIPCSKVEPMLSSSSVLHTVNLDKDSNYSVSAFVTIPSNIPAGDYHYIVFTDADDNVYEHSNNNNNIHISSKEYVDGYPPVDLRVTDVTAPDTVRSGKSVMVSWTVKNMGQAATAANFWEDCVYFSTDSVWGSNDTRLYSEQINTTVSKDSQYTVNATFTAPNGSFRRLLRIGQSRQIGCQQRC